MCHDLLDVKLCGVQFSLLLLGLETLITCIQRKGLLLCSSWLRVFATTTSHLLVTSRIQ